MINEGPKQLDWDTHLIRNWYANKFGSMLSAELSFGQAWGRMPHELGFVRHSYKSGISIWKFLELMPSVDKVVKRHGRDRAEEIARKMFEANVKSGFQRASHIDRADRREISKNEKLIDARRHIAERTAQHKRSNQWGVCK